MSLTITPGLDSEEMQLVRNKLDEANAEAYGPAEVQEFGLGVRNEHGDLVGGLIGSILWDWLHVHVIWVSKDLRSKGHGAELLAAGEQEGRRRGAKYVKLHTFSFQARPFYEKQGYRVIAETKDFPEGHSQYLMFKTL